MRNEIDLIVRGARVLVRFAVQPPDPGVGILSEWTEGHTLHDEQGARLVDLESALSDAEWEEVADVVDERLPQLRRAQEAARLERLARIE
ncbi:MAG: hypothetical protein ACM31O_14120 [Bacteroidota bacterium]